MQVIYQFPGDDDRYLDLFNECQRFVLKNDEAGLKGMIAIGTFEIGMEFLLLQLARLFGPTIWMNELRQKFLRLLGMDNCENAKRIVRPLIKCLAKTSSDASIHVLDVHNIHRDVGSNFNFY